ncbi:Transmembrane protein [Ceratobasidium theobromae]|uniref:Transmembrane protein n=1 Tax=Ceratobasidium theobromae TaxID=1582974 RepID=A0A5N5QAA5_9AGAM|nr:Transmembrane protein [Ceratobasidium theobromae]
MLADVEACARAILALGAKVDVDATVKADIAVKVAAIVTVIVKACVSLVAKFGIALCLTILAQVDICLKLLLVNLSVCIEGIIALVVKIVASLGVDAFVGVHLNLCLGVLGYLKL